MSFVRKSRKFKPCGYKTFIDEDRAKSHGYTNLIQINHMHTQQTFIEITFTGYKTLIKEV